MAKQPNPITPSSFAGTQSARKVNGTGTANDNAVAPDVGLVDDSGNYITPALDTTLAALAALFSGGTAKMGQAAQVSATTVLANAATGNVAVGAAPNGSTDGYEALQLFISNGAGTATVTIYGSLDPAFAVAQDALPLGLVKLSDSVAGTNLTRQVVSGVITVAANTSYLFSIYDVLPNVRAVITNASGLAGLTIKLFKMAV